MITFNAVRDASVILGTSTSALINSYNPGQKQKWQCLNCTFINDIKDKSCIMCDFGWTGQKECPPGKWKCSECTYFNPKSLFYCSVCDTARPDLATVDF